MKICYVSTYNAQNINEWSGLGYYIAKVLADNGFELDFFGDLEIPSLLQHKLKGKFYRSIFKKEYDLYREPSVISHFGKQIDAHVEKTKPDVLFAPSSIPLAKVKSAIPKIFYTDTTFEGVVGFYEKFSNYTRRSFINAHKMEQAAINNANMIIYSSDWAARQAIDVYHCSEEKIKLLPFGANVNSNLAYNEIQEIIRNRSREVMQLLFLGVDWERKGGSKAFEVAQTLNNMGIRCELHLAGCQPEGIASKPEWLIDHGFINKALPEGQKLLNELMCNSHFLLLPSEADCTPVVFSELNSYGVPSISTKVGGIPFIIQDEKNGKTFKLDESAETYANYLANKFKNYDEYILFAESSYREYEQRLSWNVIGKKLTQFIEELFNTNTNEI